jgi:hypothetical protein
MSLTHVSDPWLVLGKDIIKIGRVGVLPVQADRLISKIWTETSELMKESVGFGLWTSLNKQSFLKTRLG